MSEQESVRYISDTLRKWFKLFVKHHAKGPAFSLAPVSVGLTVFFSSHLAPTGWVDSMARAGYATLSIGLVLLVGSVIPLVIRATFRDADKRDG